SSLFICLSNDLFTTLSLHDALPISCRENPFIKGFLEGSRLVAHFLLSWGKTGGKNYRTARLRGAKYRFYNRRRRHSALGHLSPRSEEHTSELQSRENLVCCLLLEQK